MRSSVDATAVDVWIVQWAVIDSQVLQALALAYPHRLKNAVTHRYETRAQAVVNRRCAWMWVQSVQVCHDIVPRDNVVVKQLRTARLA